MIKKKWIAGIVMLTQLDGTKLFLIKLEKTGLASILEVLKAEANIEISRLKLLELTNGVIAGTNVPLFVFELDEQVDVPNQLPEGYLWQSFGQMQKVIQKFEIEGMPYF